MPATTRRQHILSVLVEDKPGVLARVSGLFARRGYNIHSLAVAPTDDERFSRITVVVDAETAPLEQIVKQLDKLINVVRIDELAPGAAVERELLLVTVRAPAETRSQIIELIGVFEGRVVGVGYDEITLVLEGHPQKLDDFAELIDSYGVVALQRTGRVALPRIEKRSPQLSAVSDAS
jgi:acetolactate synthase-1/3 small subunit